MKLRLLLALLSALVLLFLGAGLILGHWFEERLETELDERIDARSSAIAGLLENDPEGLEFDFNPAAMPEYTRIVDPSFFELRRDGEVLHRSPNLDRLGAGLDLLLEEGDDDFEVAGFALRGQRRDLELHQVQRDEDEPEMEPIDLVVLVASDRAALDRSLARFRRGLIVALLVLVALVVLVTTLSIRFGLSPLRELNDKLRDLDHESLGQELELRQEVTEIRPLVATLNELFRRLKSAYDREREMTGNVAHELRTPIAELKLATELARDWPEDVELRDAALSTATQVSVRMERLVGALLRLARLEEGRAPMRLETVPLDDLVVRVVDEVRRQDQGREIELAVHAPDLIATDIELLSLALRNLLVNAVAHASGPGAIVVETETGAGQALISVSNPFPGAAALISEGKLEVAFWRGDAARSGDDHEGLGLAICSQVMKGLGGELRFSAVAGRFVAELRFST